MISFKKLALSDIELIKPYFFISETRTCDNTIGGSFMWRDFFHTEYAIINNTLVFKVVYLQGNVAFSMPLGEDVTGALKEVYDYCNTLNIPVVICTATENDILLLKADYNVKADKEDDWSDYLYSADDLATMSGRKYNGQRNHINHFKKENPEYSFQSIDESNISAVLSFYEKFCSSEDNPSPIFQEEKLKVYEVLNNFRIYDQISTVLYVKDTIVAFAVGEIIKDTLYVHIEKADTNYGGSYQMITKEFAESNLKNGIVYVNREEDVGDEGLRTSKMSYHPCSIIDKYTAVCTARSVL